MFGFFGKQQGEITIESNGLATSNRYFDIYFGTNLVPASNPLRSGYMLFDIDDESETKPNSRQVQTVQNYGVETYNSLIGAWNESSQIGNRLFDETYLTLNGSVRGWLYTSPDALTPPTRKFKMCFTNPEILEVINITPRVNNQGRTSTNNNGTGSLLLNLNQFPNLKYLLLDEMWVDTLDIRADLLTKLEVIEMRELLNLTGLTGKAPASVKKFKIGSLSPLTGITEFISEAVNCEVIQFGHWSPPPTFLDTYDALLGTLEISHMTNLKEFAIGNSNLTSVNFPTVPSNNWRIFFMWFSNTAVANTDDSLLDSVLTSTNLEFFGIHQSNRLWTKDFGNEDISPVMTGMYLWGNRITGDFILTEPRLLLKDLRLGMSANESNVFANINLSGLSSGVTTTLYLTGISCENLQLPKSLPSLTLMWLFDNKLSIVTNPDLATKINNYTLLDELRLGNTTTGGQNGVGFGADVDFSGLVNLRRLLIDSCGFTGSLTLPNVNKLIEVSLLANNITSVVNLSAHTGLMNLIWSLSTVDLDLSSLVNLGTIDCTNQHVQTVINLSGRTSVGGVSMNVQVCSGITAVHLPASSGSSIFGAFRINTCKNLTEVTNLDKVRTTQFVEMFGNTSLNMIIPFGINLLLPATIRLENTGFDVTNLDATIDNIYTYRSKWTSGAKTLNIGGTNVAPSGTYQAPSGFVEGVSDGTPTSAKEQLYVLVNNYAWTVTMN